MAIRLGSRPDQGSWRSNVPHIGAIKLKYCDNDRRSRFVALVVGARDFLETPYVDP
jgi:hypothetical protein